MGGIDNGTGASVTFGTSSFNANIAAISHDGIERASIPTSHLGTSNDMTFMPGDLVDPGELTLDIQFDPEKYPPISGAAETITLNFPLNTGESTASNWQFSGFATSFNFAVPLEDLMTGQLNVKASGAITRNAAT